MQVRVLPVSEKSLDYAQEVFSAIVDTGARATLDSTGERLQAKIKIASEWKIPYLLVVGPRDAEQKTVSVRARGIRHDLGALPLHAFIESLQKEISTRGAETVLEKLKD